MHNMKLYDILIVSNIFVNFVEYAVCIINVLLLSLFKKVLHYFQHTNITSFEVEGTNMFTEMSFLLSEILHLHITEASGLSIYTTDNFPVVVLRDSQERK